MTKAFYTGTVTETYKGVSDHVNNPNWNNEEVVIAKSLNEILKESFFHGASKFGNNFIA
jgi:hypothetical protein